MTKATATAANTKILAHVRKTYNAKIYKTARAVYNASGREALTDYILTFIREDKQADRKAELLEI